MKLLVNVSVGLLEEHINRQILVDENLNLRDFCEYVITSLNGSKMPIYIIEYKNVYYFPYEIKESKNEKSAFSRSLKSLKLEKKSGLTIQYNSNSYFINVVVDDIVDDKVYPNMGDFTVLSGKGYGIEDSNNAYGLEGVFRLGKTRPDNLKKSEREFIAKQFDYEESNRNVNEYKKWLRERELPKSYIMNVSLEGFNKVIKRKISVNSNITLDDFCKKIVLSMNGDLSHCCLVKFGKEYLGKEYEYLEVYYWNLKEKQKFKVIYDMGDNWVFNISVSKIVDGYGENDFEVISGQGYGIVDDCGGSWGLAKIFNGEYEDWGEYDINDFDLEECNKKVKSNRN